MCSRTGEDCPSPILNQSEEVTLAENTDGIAFCRELQSFPMFRTLVKACELRNILISDHQDGSPSYHRLSKLTAGAGSKVGRLAT